MIGRPMCEFVLQSRCNRGDKCRFAHGEVEELPTPPRKRARVPTPPRSPTPPRKRVICATPLRSSTAAIIAERPVQVKAANPVIVRETPCKRFARTAEEVKKACEVYDHWFHLGSEAKHCDAFPQYFVPEDGYHRCMLCNKMATQAHLNQRRHQSRFERPDFCDLAPHGDSMPWPREDDIRWKCLKAMEDNSAMTLEKAEAILNPIAQAQPVVKAKAMPKSDKKEIPKIDDKLIILKTTIFSDLGVGPMTYLKITILERRLDLGIISKDDFQEQHPRGARSPRRPHLEGQEFLLCEYALTKATSSTLGMITDSVVLITDYVDGFYSGSHMGKHRGLHFDNLREGHLEPIHGDKWRQLYKDDQLLFWDIVGVDNGVAFPRINKSWRKRILTGGKSSSSNQLPTKDSSSVSSSSSASDMKPATKKTGKKSKR